MKMKQWDWQMHAPLVTFKIYSQCLDRSPTRLAPASMETARHGPFIENQTQQPTPYARSMIVLVPKIGKLIYVGDETHFNNSHQVPTIKSIYQSGAHCDFLKSRLWRAQVLFAEICRWPMTHFVSWLSSPGMQTDPLFGSPSVAASESLFNIHWGHIVGGIWTDKCRPNYDGPKNPTFSAI